MNAVSCIWAKDDFAIRCISLQVRQTDTKEDLTVRQFQGFRFTRSYTCDKGRSLIDTSRAAHLGIRRGETQREDSGEFCPSVRSVWVSMTPPAAQVTGLGTRGMQGVVAEWSWRPLWNAAWRSTGLILIDSFQKEGIQKRALNTMMMKTRPSSEHHNCGAVIPCRYQCGCARGDAS